MMRRLDCLRVFKGLVKMKILKLLSALLLTFSLLSAAESANGNVAVGKKLRVALYVDNGSRGSGVLHWTEILAFAPQVEFSTLMGEDVRKGRLNEIDLLVMPGGASWWQCPSLGEAGMQLVREFIRKGGAYAGTCAGMSSVMDEKDRLALVPYKSRKELRGGTGTVSVEILPEGAKLLGIKAGVRSFRYAGGPIAIPSDKPGDERTAQVLATFKSMVTRNGRNEGGFNYPAMILGKYGKGKVIVTSFHPESWEAAHDVVAGAIYAVTGVKITPEFPKKNPRPLRVGFYSGTMIGHAAINAAVKLIQHPDMDVRYIMMQDIIEGELNHLDCVVIPESVDFLYKKNMAMELYRKAFRKFMDKGGIILTDQSCGNYIEPHRNLKNFSNETDLIKRLCSK